MSWQVLESMGGPAHQVLEYLRSLHVGLFDGNILFGQEKNKISALLCFSYLIYLHT